MSPSREQDPPSPSAYVPIACGVHDRLEAYAVTRTECTVTWRPTPDAPVRSVVAHLEDVYASGGAEFLRLSTGDEVRLDRIEEVRPRPV